MKILLLTGTNPRKVKVWVCQETSIIGSMIPPTDLCYIAAYCEKRGHEARVVDLRMSPDWEHTLTRAIHDFDPDFVCTNLVTTSFHEDITMLQKCKTIDSSLKVCAFGTHAESRIREVLVSGAVDYVFTGDAEQCMVNLLEGVPLGYISQEASNPPAFLTNLDEIPYDFPRFIDLDRYHAAHHAGSKRFLPLLASRGCPYLCTYCLYPSLFGKQGRYRSIEGMVNELEILNRDFNIQSVNYLDATFNLQKKRLMEFCNLLAAKKLPIAYACNLRCDLLDEKLVDALARSGCNRVYLGVEDPNLLDATLKHLSFAKIKNAFRLFKDSGIETVAFLMLFKEGAPDEEKYFKHMRDVIRTIEPDAIQINVSIPFPGTTDFEQVKDQLNLDWGLFDPSGNALPYECDLDLARVKRQLYRNFILSNPAKVMKVLSRLAWRQWPHLARQFFDNLVLYPNQVN